MKPTDVPVEGPKNNPMMPVAWTKSYKSGEAKTARVFTTTMGSSTDFATEGTRRLIVNACYWAIGLEEKIAPKSNVELVGEFKPRNFSFGGAEKGKKPSDLLK
jgi:type 1 glutamine amidotransferase